MTSHRLLLSNEPASPSGEAGNRLVFSAEIPYPPSGIDHAYSGTRQGRLRKNAAISAWQDQIVYCLYAAGCRDIGKMREFHLAIDLHLVTKGMDVDACVKHVADAAAAACFGLTYDSIGRPIYPDAWTGRVTCVKEFAEGKPESLEIIVTVTRVDADKDAFNAIAWADWRFACGMRGGAQDGVIPAAHEEGQ